MSNYRWTCNLRRLRICLITLSRFLFPPASLSASSVCSIRILLLRLELVWLHNCFWLFVLRNWAFNLINRYLGCLELYQRCIVLVLLQRFLFRLDLSSSGLVSMLLSWFSIRFKRLNWLYFYCFSHCSLFILLWICDSP